MADSLQRLFEAGSERYDLGDYDAFYNKMANPQSRQKFYVALSKHYDLGDYDTFDQKVSRGFLPPENQEPDQLEARPGYTEPGNGNGDQPQQQPNMRDMVGQFVQDSIANDPFLSEVDTQLSMPEPEPAGVHQYETPIPPDKQQAFNAWRGQQQDSGQDYDLAGYWMSGAATDERGHGTDEFKKPNHPTFSTESMYSGQGDEQGGTWGEEQGKWSDLEKQIVGRNASPPMRTTFTPGPSNLKYHSRQELEDYFKEVEPNVKLKWPENNEDEGKMAQQPTQQQMPVDAPLRFGPYYNLKENEQRQIEEMQKKDYSSERGFIDTIKQTKPQELVPFLAGALETADMLSLYKAAQRLKAGEASENDIIRLEDFIQKTEQKTTKGGKVADVLTMLPAFIGEFITTSGVYSAGRKATTMGIAKGLEYLAGKAGKKALKEQASKIYAGKGAASVLAKIAGGSVGATMQTPLAMATRIPATALRQMMPDMQLSESDSEQLQPIITGEGEDAWGAVKYALGDAWVEVMSEHSGGLLGIMGSPLRNVVAKTAIARAWKKANPFKSWSVFKDIIHKGGWNGTIPEWFEERVGEVGRAAIGNEEYTPPTREQMEVELIAFSVPGVTFATTEMVMGKKERRRVAEQLKRDMRTASRNVASSFGVTEGAEGELDPSGLNAILAARTIQENQDYIDNALDQQVDASDKQRQPFTKDLGPEVEADLDGEVLAKAQESNEELDARVRGQGIEAREKARQERHQAAMGLVSTLKPGDKIYDPLIEGWHEVQAVKGDEMMTVDGQRIGLPTLLMSPGVKIQHAGEQPKAPSEIDAQAKSVLTDMFGEEPAPVAAPEAQGEAITPEAPTGVAKGEVAPGTISELDKAASEMDISEEVAAFEPEKADEIIQKSGQQVPEQDAERQRIAKELADKEPIYALEADEIVQINADVERLGSIDEVGQRYYTDSYADRYARQRAERLYGTAERQVEARPDDTKMVSSDTSVRSTIRDGEPTAATERAIADARQRMSDEQIDEMQEYAYQKSDEWESGLSAKDKPGFRQSDSVYDSVRRKIRLKAEAEWIDNNLGPIAPKLGTNAPETGTTQAATQAATQAVEPKGQLKKAFEGYFRQQAKRISSTSGMDWIDFKDRRDAEGLAGLIADDLYGQYAASGLTAREWIAKQWANDKYADDPQYNWVSRAVSKATDKQVERINAATQAAEPLTLSQSGQPYKTEAAAKRRAKSMGIGYRTKEVPNGWAVYKEETAQAIEPEMKPAAEPVSAAPVSGVAETKQPWEMTRGEWASTVGGRSGLRGTQGEDVSDIYGAQFFKGRHLYEATPEESRYAGVSYDVRQSSPPTPDVKQTVEYRDWDTQKINPKEMSYDASIVDPNGAIIDNRYAKPESVFSPKPDNNFMFRGMSSPEFEKGIQGGQMRSLGHQNFSNQVGETYFSNNSQQAYSYAAGFSAWYDLPSYEQPSYVIKVKKEGLDVIPQSGDELAVRGEIPTSLIDKVYEVRVATEHPGKHGFDVRGWGSNKLSEGSRQGMQQRYVVRELPKSEWGKTYHRKAVEQALSSGKPVPPEVLAEYPGLANVSTVSTQAADVSMEPLILATGPKGPTPFATQQAAERFAKGRGEGYEAVPYGDNLWAVRPPQKTAEPKRELTTEERQYVEKQLGKLEGERGALEVTPKRSTGMTIEGPAGEGAAINEMEDRGIQFSSASVRPADNLPGMGVLKVEKTLQGYRNRFNIPIRVVGGVEDLEGAQFVAVENVQKGGNVVSGFYDPYANEIVVLGDTVRNEAELLKAILPHEIAHYGIEGTLGEKGYNEFIDGLLQDPVIRPEILKLMNENKLKVRDAAKEWFAIQAEGRSVDEINPTIWQRIVALFRRILRKFKGAEAVGFTHNDVDVMLRDAFKYAQDMSRAPTADGEGDVQFRTRSKDDLLKELAEVEAWLANPPEVGGKRVSDSLIQRFEQRRENLMEQIASMPGGLSFRVRKKMETFTAEFKKWFGNSKVVDDSGEPLVVYHGDPVERTVYDDPEKLGVWLTPSKRYAKHYTRTTGPVKGFYVRAENPIPDTKAGRTISAAIAKEARGRGLSFPEVAKEQGYDGVYHFGKDELLVFDSNQVKETTNLRPTDSPDIRFRSRKAEGPRLDKKVKALEATLPEKNKDELIRRHKSTTIRAYVDALKQGHLMGQRDLKSALKEIGSFILNYAKDYLPREGMTRGQVKPLLYAVVNAETADDMIAAYNRIDAISRTVTEKQLLAQIEDKLEKNRPKKKDGKWTGKLSPETHTLLGQIEAITKMPVEDVVKRQAELAESIKNKDGDLSDSFDESIAAERLELHMLSRFGDLKSKTVSELSAILEDVKTVIKMGRLERKAKEEERAERIGKKRAKGIDNVTGGVGVLSEQAFVARHPEGISTNAVKAALYESYTLDEFLDLISSKAKKERPLHGFLNREIIPLIHKSQRLEENGKAEKYEKVLAKLLELYETNSQSKMAKLQAEDSMRVDTGIKVTPEGGEETPLVVSQNEAVTIWMQWQRPMTAAGFKKMGFTQDTIDALWDFMLPRSQKKAEWLLYEMYPSMYSGANVVFEKIAGVTLPHDPFYSPVIRDTKEEIKEDYLLSAGPKFTAAIYSNRLKATVPNALPIRLKDCDVMLEQTIAETEHFKAWAENMRDIRGILGHHDMQRAIAQNYGQVVLQGINRHLDDIARGAIDPLLVDNIANRIRGNLNGALLGFNISLTPKQASSVLAYGTEIPLIDFTKNLAEFWKNPSKNMDFIIDTDYFKTRYKMGYDRDMVANLARSVKDKSFGVKSKYKKANYIFANLGDQFSIIYGGWAVYKYYYDQAMKQPGMTTATAKAIALEEFETASNRTQQSGFISDMPGMMRKGSWTNFLTMFVTQQNIYFRKESTALRNLFAGRGSKAENIKIFAMSHFILPMWWQFVYNGFDWDDEDQLRAAILGSLNGWVFWGTVAEAAVERALGSPFGEVSNPLFDSINNATRNVVAAYDYVKDGDYDATEGVKMANKILGSLLVFKGIAYERVGKQVKSMYEYLDEPKGKSLMRFIGYSPYALRSKEGGREQKRNLLDTLEEFNERPKDERDSRELEQLKSEIEDYNKNAHLGDRPLITKNEMQAAERSPRQEAMRLLNESGERVLSDDTARKFRRKLAIALENEDINQRQYDRYIELFEKNQERMELLKNKYYERGMETPRGGNTAAPRPPQAPRPQPPRPKRTPITSR